MDDATFRNLLDPWMSTGAQQLVITIPSGSGIFRVIDVPSAKYQTGFVSTSAGSFKSLGESGNWYGTDPVVSFTEASPTGVPIYEATKFKQDVPFLSAFNLPQDLRTAIYDDRTLQSCRYSKSHIVLELAAQYLPQGSYSGVYFPSRREDGGVLTFDPSRIPIEFRYTGIHPPPPELFR